MTTIELPAASPPQAAAPARIRTLCILFFFSGFPALIYQLTWQRSLFRIFGVNTESVTIVVTAFMLGLGLGSLAGGWLSKRDNIKPLLLLGTIELATAAFGLVSLSVFDLVGRLTSDMSLPAIAAINLLLVLLPTLMMGATLPILVSYLVRISGQIGSAVGTLYFVNTLGAGAACLMSGVLIFPFLGMHSAIMIAAGLNITVGLGAIAAHVIGRAPAAASPGVSIHRTAAPVLGMGFVSALAVAGGFISLSYEIYLFRTISFASGSSSLAFAITLCSFLIGIAVGAQHAGQVCETRSAKDAIARAAMDLVWANGFAAAFLPLIAQLASNVAAMMIVAVIATYLIARQWGALLPYLSQFGIAADAGAGQQTALLYFSNIVGCATGAVLTGFVLTDYFGLKQMAVLLLIAGTLCALVLAYSYPATRRERLRFGVIATSVLVLGIAANALFAQRLLENLQSKSIADHDFARVVENHSGIITIDTEGTVFGNGMYDGAFNTDVKHDRNGIIRPYTLSLFHGAPRDVLMIGLASGSWAQVIANNPDVASLTVVEINRGYLQIIAAQDDVKSVLNNPKVRIIEDDGRRWLTHHPEAHFDAVVVNATWHFRANASNLLSSEFMELVKRHLNEGGIYLYNTTNSRRAQRTACVAFAHGAHFLNHMVVSQSPIDWNHARWRRTLEAYRIDGKPEFAAGNAADQAVLDRLMTDYREDGPMFEQCPQLPSATEGETPITDDNMGTEWRYFLGLE
ncbi:MULTISPECIES: fused MFS/spermidine synthase [unclassified Bradyrhizobium]|uniref:fused MFS/spermidine synthase n=1 Tax=unclassified Bradyrhizobium TaxID=2631580 RepID=UPI002478EAD0|nr:MULTISPECIES: fused MFS/spermidine synthase [unclassified Bradyrhizobium]WGR71030.1 fused MFS/spermidine synthase [Bradyrhizobium sp. ISRA426]WGR75867.1 fused MFS/spermidine synthase [Bradyrhizobium sp. ISRA430]WGR86271.1 fused MFS/spermidine synthase [Bradyrhizobium sp. ISRA432]